MRKRDFPMSVLRLRYSSTAHDQLLSKQNLTRTVLGMNFIMYNFLQPKLNFVHLPQLEKT